MEDGEKQESNDLTDIEKMHNSLENNEITKIVELICERTNSQRQNIKENYYSSYGIEILKEFESKLSGNVKDLILGLMMTSEDFDANQIYNSIKGFGTDEATLSEIIATRPSRHLLQVKERYPILFEKTLDSDITGDTSKCYQKILIAIIQGKRSDNPYPNSQKMKEIVEKLSKDGKIQEDNIVKLFSSCSYGEICTICRLYEKIYNESILDDIKKTVDGDAYEFFETLLQYISDAGRYFAEKLHNFKEKDFTRILISRSEVNMDEIRDSYKELYFTDLVDDIKNNFNGDYQLGLTILAKK